MKECIIDIESTSFKPWQGKIICIGTKNIKTGEIKVFHDQNEKEILIRLFKYHNEEQFKKYIGFNLGFDIRFIFGKCLQYQLPTNGFFLTRQTDLLTILRDVGMPNTLNKAGTLDQWVKSVLGKQKTYPNHLIPDLYLSNRIQDIIEYNKNDLEITFELWQRIQKVLEGHKCLTD
mgnify:CR=1 FL=1